jgi:hypothetical protein
MPAGASRTPDSPGWYPDPAGNGRMRRWDGRGWTGESRPMPPWASRRTATRRRIGTHWYVMGGVVAFLFLATTAKAFLSKPDLPKRTIYDASFIAAANTDCRGELAQLKDARPKPGSKASKDPGSEDQVAAQVDDAANRLHAIANRLRNLPVAAGDQADVARWLAEWDRYVDLGHQYADAVRRKDGVQTKIADVGAKSGQKVTLFAQANKMNDCTIA